MQSPSLADFKITGEDLLRKTILQIEKDWNRAGLEPVDFDNVQTAEKVIDKLGIALNELISKTPESLPTLLYLIDLNEVKLMWQSGQMTVEKLTEAIIKREFYKVKLRSIL